MLHGSRLSGRSPALPRCAASTPLSFICTIRKWSFGAGNASSRRSRRLRSARPPEASGCARNLPPWAWKTSTLTNWATCWPCSSLHLQPARNIVFIGNVGEEGEGNLRGMRHLFSAPPWRDAIHSLLVIDGAGTDTYVNQALGSRRFEVTFHSPGGHSWSDFGVPNPIVLLSASMEELQKLEDRLRECVAEAWNEVPLSYRAGEPKVTLAIESIGDRPAAELPAETRILQIVRAVDKHLRIESFPRLASTDANVPLSLGLEATTIGAGGDGGGAHTF